MLGISKAMLAETKRLPTGSEEYKAQSFGEREGEPVLLMLDALYRYALVMSAEQCWTKSQRLAWGAALEMVLAMAGFRGALAVECNKPASFSTAVVFGMAEKCRKAAGI